MDKQWSQLECEAIVADYFDMLNSECLGKNYSKAAHRRALQSKLNNRSDGSIEYKHQNISAVLIRAGHIYIRGYKPAWNYQELLEMVVLERIAISDQMLKSAEGALIGRCAAQTCPDRIDNIVVEPPEMVLHMSVRDSQSRSPLRISYAEKEARNRRLGELGEGFVLEFEKCRLQNMGRKDLADDIEWTSKEKGDGVGYDIRSFFGETDEPRFIEVKTTNAGKYQPFLLSVNELSFSKECSENFSLYRVFDFSYDTRLFQLNGNIASHVNLNATQFRASF